MSTTDIRPFLLPEATTTARPADADVLTATGVQKSFWRGIWPRRHQQPVLRGVDLTLHPG
jgi:ABC-2 type transport system ATP-binding protein